MKEYEKIKTAFVRRTDGSKKLIEGVYVDDALDMLSDILWEWTEKIDGTNIRVHWDGHTVEFGGRTDNASIPAPLVNRLNELFGGEANAQLFEQTFGEKDVLLFGEGYGNKIQKVGALYKPDGVDFILFDVCINGKYLERDGVNAIADMFGVKHVPIIFNGTIRDAVKYVKEDRKSWIGGGAAPMEGLVGRPPVELRDGCGNRIIVKLKHRDFEEDHT